MAEQPDDNMEDAGFSDDEELQSALMASLVEVRELFDCLCVGRCSIGVPRLPNLEKLAPCRSLAPCSHSQAPHWPHSSSRPQVRVLGRSASLQCSTETLTPACAARC